MSYGRGPPNSEGMISLKVDNLTYRTTPENLKRAFEKYGDVGDVYIPRDRFTRESRGFAFVRFYDKRDAEDAMDSMDGAIFDGRELRVQTARYGRPDTRRGGPPRRYGGGYSRNNRDRSRSRSRSRDRRGDRRRRSDSRSRRSRSYSRSRSRSPKSQSRSRSRSQSKGSDRGHSRSRSPAKSDHSVGEKD
ncbi:serine/arginine-rich splicing factor 2-like isoform X2 [Gigantopelta aegis]|uniref:serine/arginine-rich splicing factor 2-like isoform X2 n=1 Tax=Gigantopelta aegis TaxID=1735272 RepID=UPI001B88DEDE|nr:serine/arginine-rich splicing factor 2-like isoform X2 [Gigantopelta aegis]